MVNQGEILIPQSQHFRNMVAILFAMVIGVIVVGTVESIGQAVYPPPADLDMNDTAQMKRYLARLPAAALLFVIGGWSAGIFCGCLFAGIMGFRQGTFCSIVYSILFCSVVGLMLYEVPLPLWFTVFGIVILAPSALAGWGLSRWTLLRFQSMELNPVSQNEMAAEPEPQNLNPQFKP